ncbi:MAG: ubiquinol-cytochrome c reductase iron-sulfur subunit [Rhizobiaceae bacterium]
MSEAHVSDETRRDFLYIATGAAGAVVVGGIAWPLVSQMGPNKEVQAAGGPVEIDISSVEPGMQLTVVWRSKPYFVRRLTKAEVTAASEAPKDKFIDFAEAKPRIAAAKGATAEWAIVSASCTHLGCIPTKIDLGLEGWLCPCHGSKFDVTGRVTKGPAPINLPLPPFQFASADKLIIGLEKKGA